MSIEDDDDRAELLADDGVTITVGANTFTGLFDNEYVETLGISGTFPVVLCRSSDVTAYSVAIDTELVIDSTTYKVKVPQADGTGFTKLILEQQ